MSIDPVTLALARSYTDEKLGGGGGGIPHFNLSSLGLPTIAIGGSAHLEDVETDEIVEAIKGGIVTVVFNANINSFTLPITVTMTGAYIEAMQQYQANCLLVFDTSLIRLSLVVRNGDIALYSSVVSMLG